MRSIQADLKELRKQLRAGLIQRGYRALLGYMMSLRTHFKNRYPRCFISGLYQGYMDMTYFAIVLPPFKRRGLKLAIVFNYEEFRFEAWLAGTNRRVQQKYWELFRDSRWTENRVVKPATGVDSIIERNLTEEVDLSDRDRLTAIIEEKAIEFIGDSVVRYPSRGWLQPQARPDKRTPAAGLASSRPARGHRLLVDVWIIETQENWRMGNEDS